MTPFTQGNNVSDSRAFLCGPGARLKIGLKYSGFGCLGIRKRPYSVYGSKPPCRGYKWFDGRSMYRTPKVWLVLFESEDLRSTTFSGAKVRERRFFLVEEKTGTGLESRTGELWDEGFCVREGRVERARGTPGGGTAPSPVGRPTSARTPGPRPHRPGTSRPSSTGGGRAPTKPWPLGYRYRGFGRRKGPSGRGT